MRNLYKLILAGFVAFGTSCMKDDSSVAGATTEPNSLQAVNLTEEQKTILARAINTVNDSTKEYSDSGAVEVKYVNAFFVGSDNQVFSYPSKDGRRVCDVVSFSGLNPENAGEGVFQAMAYDEKERTCFVYGDAGTNRQTCSTGVYVYDHYPQTLIGSKIIEVDSFPVVLNVLDARNWYGENYWGYGVTCSETLENFKQSCRKLNGLFKDFADGCRDSQLSLACASFVPEGASEEALLESYTQEYRDECVADSLRYAPFEDENYVPYDRYSDSLFVTDTAKNVRTANRWIYELKQSLNAYRWQFTISNLVIDEYGGITFDELGETDYPELRLFSSLYSYNTLPDSKIADAYRKEGAYVLPDSLVEQFFPLAASVPFGLRYAGGEFFGSLKTDIFYMIVVKDVGAKGHILRDSDADGIYVTDIVKSGESCPVDTTVHYSAFLVVNSPEWDVLGKPIVKKTFVSENWNCDKPETLEKIEPYGEWAFSGTYNYDEYVELDLYEE